jgi:hypothetical protein
MSLVDKVDLIRADILGTEQLGGFAKMRGILGNGVNVVVLCAGSKIAYPHVFDHPSTQGAPFCLRLHKELLLLATVTLARTVCLKKELFALK